jgi:PD-(D/E)XK nuclease superfamily domain
MPGKAQAVSSGHQLRDQVADLGVAIGLAVEKEVEVGRRVWGARRKIDVVLKHRETRVSLGVECKYQGSSGSAEEKIAATLQDIRAWPIRGIVVYAGQGFSANMVSYLMSTGMAVELADLRKWLELYFGI